MRSLKLGTKHVWTVGLAYPSSTLKSEQTNCSIASPGGRCELIKGGFGGNWTVLGDLTRHADFLAASMMRDALFKKVRWMA